MSMLDIISRIVALEEENNVLKTKIKKLEDSIKKLQDEQYARIPEAL